MNINRLEGETELSYIWRLCSAKDNGELDMNWLQIGEILNKELREDETQYYSESAYRKRYQAAKEFYNEIFKNMQGAEIINDIEEKMRELKKERFRLSDERSAFNKNLREDARLEDRLDRLEMALVNSGEKEYPPFVISRKDNEDVELLIIVSDLHLGQTFSNGFGEYNSDIAKDRLEIYLNEIIDIKNQYGVTSCYIALLGDLISGNIHQSIAITNRENVIEQITMAGELLSDFVYMLSGAFNHIVLKSVSGNHSRLTRKDDALKDERLDYIVPFIIKSKLSHIDSVTIDLANNFDSTIAYFDILGKNYIAVHGDYDNFSKRGISDLSMMLGYIPDGIICGHLHTPGFIEECGVKMIRGGSFAGAGDDYTIEKRLVGKPSQTVCLCTEKGIKAIFPIELV